MGSPPRSRDGTGAPRVVLVDPSSRGGIVSYTQMVANALELVGIEPVVLASVDLAVGDPRLERCLPADRWGKPEHAGPGFYLRRLLTWCGSARAVSRYVRRRHPDIVHFQAPFNRRFDAFLLRRLRRRAAVVWTAHDVLPFERTERDRKRFAAIYATADRVVVHTAVAAGQLRALAGVEAVVIEHPVAGDVIRVSRAEARRRLGLPASGRIFAALGFIRPYKGYALLADVWEHLGEAAPTLLVMGELMAAGERPVVDRLEGSGRAEIRLGYASDEDLQLAITASNALLLPYQEASESGLLHLAQALGVPVIASDAPQLAAAVAATAAGLVVPRTVEAWSAALSGDLPPPPSKPPSLEQVGRAYLSLYRELLRERA